MPRKIVDDEDRARRREELERKRAARKAARTAMVRREVAAAVEEKEGTKKEEAASDDEDHREENGGKDSAGPSRLLSLPDDALNDLASMLPAADLGRLTGTCRRTNRLLGTGRVPYLLGRLRRRSTGLGMCDTQEDARRLWRDSLAAGRNNGDAMAPPGRRKTKKSSVDSDDLQFVAYARFVEEACAGYATLSRKATGGVVTTLPAHVQGRFASCSPEHSLCRVGGDGAETGAGGSGVAAWGVGRRGQLGTGKREDRRDPVRLAQGRLGYGTRVVQVSAGGGLVRVAHSLLLTDAGKVLSFGTGQYGALGHGCDAAGQLPDCLRPRYVSALLSRTVTCVAAGELHSAAATVDGDVFTWGDGFCGQLGHGDKRPVLQPRLVAGIEDEVVSTISCGGRHTLAVTEDGEAYSWGLGHFGVLGRSFTPFDYDADAAVVALVANPNNDDGENSNNGAAVLAMADAAAERREAAALHETAELSLEAAREAVQEAAADNQATELAAHLDLIANLSLDDSSDQCIPKQIDSLEGIKIVGCSAGHRHSLLLDDKGGLYSFGAGSSGCLGHGDNLSHMYPARIQSFDEEGVRILQMSAGVDMSMAVSTTGQVFAWGKTDGGRIGLGLSKSSVTLPRRVVVPDEDFKAVDVECGYVHSIIVGLNGTLLMCGGVGIEGEEDGQTQDDTEGEESDGRPRRVPDFNIWHRLPEPKEHVKKETWKKTYGKYQVKGRSKMLSGDD